MNKHGKPGLKIERYFTKPDVNPFDAVPWEKRTAQITGSDGKVYFEQKDVEVPASWSQTATNVVAQKYFRGKLGTTERESSVRQLIGRVAATLARWGSEGGYFASADDQGAFWQELVHLLVNQMMAFNSPVWFNLGAETEPQVSACFINSVEDSMPSILELAKTEGMLFKYGSGTGTNLSVLRSSKEYLNGGGVSSGPVSFMKGFDAFAGAIKSGGKTRRAAKMVILNDNHPDIVDFVKCKAEEEKKAWALIDAGYDGGFNVAGGAYDSVAYQNANHSVRVSDEFMKAVEADSEWHTKAVTDGRTVDTYRARDLFRMMAEATHVCGDPGIQYDSTIQKYHTSKNSGRINATNPCIRKGQRILTVSGWRQIEEFDGQEVRLFDGCGYTTGKVWKTGIKRIIRLHSNNGRTVDITPDHKILTDDGWVEAKDTQGKYVPHLFPNVSFDGTNRLPRCITGVSGRYYNTQSLDLMESLGFLQGDGGFDYERYKITVHYTPDKDGDFVTRTVVPLLSDVAANPDELDYEPSENGGMYGYCRQRLAKWLSSLGMKMVPLPERTLPDFIFTSTRTSQCAFLRGLFGANGNVLKDARQAVVLVSTCREMLKEVQLLLQTMDIASSVRIHSKENDVEWANGTYTSRESYHLEITHAKDVRHFAALIGFPQASQTEKLNSICQVARKSDSPYRTKMKIVRVEELGIEDEVYDFTCPTTSTGFVNGILVHNCSEFVYLDDTACNLASLNLRKFQQADGNLDIEAFTRAVDITILAQEIMVGFAKYPTPKIEKNSHKFRPLGLGYANLGAYLMARGVTYDSDEGRSEAAAVTALMCGRAYRQSALIARDATGPFDGWEENKGPMIDVLIRHHTHADELDLKSKNQLTCVAEGEWHDALDVGYDHGYRNAQATVLAPTGTIGFMMDCDTTGIEPDIALVKYKRLVGGGMMKIVNQTVPLALDRLGYGSTAKQAILNHIEYTDTIEGAPYLKDEHLPVFDCAFRAQKGTRSIHYMGHIRMMAACQPFLSGAISKTVNLPSDCTVEDIESAYMKSWKLGLKAVAVYRDGCKRTQPLSTGKEEVKIVEVPTVATESVPMSGNEPTDEGFALVEKSLGKLTGSPEARRNKLPTERPAITHKFSVGGHEGYLTVGLYEDGTPGELFVRMSKEGSTISGLMDAFATSISVGLQHGVPLQILVDKFKGSQFTPSGFTGNPDIPRATSVMDYIFRWLDQKYGGRMKTLAELSALGQEQEKPTPALVELLRPVKETLSVAGSSKEYVLDSTAPPCHECGTITVRSGSCYKCLNCGSTSGCS